MNIRPVEHDELELLHRTFFRAMGFDWPGDSHIERVRKYHPPERSLAAFDGDRIVGTTYSHLFDLTLPGGMQIPTAGVTAVGVLATHRRRGILNALMRRQLAEASERGEPCAILIASESVIYGRYGYGLSSTLLDYELDPTQVDLDVPSPTGRVTYVDDATADKLFPALHDRWRRTQPGAINRREDWWESIREERKPGDTQVVYEDAAGEPQGFARYKVNAKWDDGLPHHSLNLQELTPLTADARNGLWSHLLRIDLVRKIIGWARPLDEPLRWMLTNPRAMRVKRMGDFLWTRVLDVPRVLGSRAYRIETDLVLDVRDPQFDDVTGRYRLQAGPDGAACEPTTRDADLELGITELGAIVLGGTSAAELGSVGRIVERADGAMARADAAFGWSPKPWSATWF
jgi:predicted acetyltransferase